MSNNQNNNEQKEKFSLIGILTSIVVILFTSTTAPWWWDKLFSSSQNPIPTPTPTPTFTPIFTPTPTPTFTPIFTSTPTPTFTPDPLQSELDKFNHLLSELQNAKSKHNELVEKQRFGGDAIPNIDSEINYWFEKYFSYDKKLIDFIKNFEQSAIQNPNAYCLPVLQAYYKYNEANKSSLSQGINELPVPLISGQLDNTNLKQYCAKIGLEYDPYSSK